MAFYDQSLFSNKELVSSLVVGNTVFAVDLYLELCKLSSDNIFFSPISMSMALAMTYLGAANNTATEMKQSLRLSNLDDDTIHEAYLDLNKVLQSGHKAFTLKTANRIFTRKSQTFLQTFLDATTKFYDAKAQSMDFESNAEASRIAINKWVEDVTAEKIKDLLPGGSINAFTAMVLVNAIYFKGDWMEKFDPRYTMPSTFTLGSGNSACVQLMFKKLKVPCGQSNILDCKIVEVPYVNKDLSMFILLPNKENGLPDLEKKLSYQVIEELTSQMWEEDVYFHLPRFKLEHKFSVKTMLENMGMKDSFTRGVADFSNMDGTKELFISDVIHKSFLEVNEEGSEAAAATAVIMMPQSACAQPTIIFKADHPFLFFIRENHSKGILFMGRLMDPKDGGLPPQSALPYGSHSGPTGTRGPVLAPYGAHTGHAWNVGLAQYDTAAKHHVHCCLKGYKFIIITSIIVIFLAMLITLYWA